MHKHALTHTHIHTHTCAHINTYTPTHTHAHMYTCMHTSTHTRTVRTVKRNILGQKRLFWGVIECFEKTSVEFGESVSSVRSITGVK